MIRPQPRSTLFPDTTLFRSGLRALVHAGEGLVEEEDWGLLRKAAGEEDPLALAAGQLADLPVRERAQAHPADRKSTRLNSSHANISYAVFCLKKKTTQHSN